MAKTKVEWIDTFFDEDYTALLKAQMAPGITKTQIDFVEAALALSPPARILDVGCGFGRHALELAKRGYEVLGMDRSPAMLKEARRLLKQKKNPVLQQGDMRKLAFKKEFDAVICLYTTFGYFSPKENLNVLNKMARALKPGGKIFIDTIDRRFLETSPRADPNNPNPWWPVKDEFFVLEDTRFDRDTGKVQNHWRIFLQQGKSWKLREKRFQLYVHYRSQIRTMAKQCSIRPLAIYSDYDIQKKKPTQGSRLIFVGKI